MRSGDLTTARLAPSPTGVLHLGNARTFLLAWLSARAQGGRVVLRLEDIDGPRVRPEACEQTIEDLRWLGLDWDGQVVMQSQRLEHYRRSEEQLVAAGLAYPCVCSRKEVEAAASAPHESAMATAIADGPVYPGTCRGQWRSRAEAEAATGRSAALRFAVDVSAVPFEDGYRGAQSGAIAGDFVISKRDSGPAYQLAVVVDDAAQAVTEVLRADDLLPSTPRQILLYRALELAEPRFVHVPLVTGSDGRRLAKRHGDTSLRHLRREGVRPQALVGYLAHLCGLRSRGSECLPGDLIAGFGLDRVSPEPVVGSDHALIGE